jgi:hypothetical protein
MGACRKAESKSGPNLRHMSEGICIVHIPHKTGLYISKVTFIVDYQLSVKTVIMAMTTIK